MSVDIDRAAWSHINCKC